MKTPERAKLAKLIKEKTKFQQTGKPRKEAEVCSKIGRHHIRNGQFQEAIEEYRYEMQLWIRQKDMMGEAMCHRSLGECYAELGYFPMALQHHDKYMAWAESTKNYAELQRALATLGRTFICKAASVDEKNSPEAKTSITKSEQALLRSMSVCDNYLKGVVSESELQQMKGRLFLNLGLVYMHQESFNKSVGSIEKAIRIAEETNKLEDLYRSHLSLADVYLRMNNTSQSLHALDNAFSLSKKLKDKEKESDVLIQRAHVHFILSEFSAAEAVLRRVCMIGSMKPAERKEVIDHVKIAKKCCKLQTELKKAMEEVNLKKVMEIHEQLGDCCCKVNIYREALLHYNKQLECALTLQIPDEQLIPIYVSLAATYADSHQYGMAVTMYGKELQLRKGNSKEECKTFLNVADAQEKAGHGYEAVYESYSKAAKFAIKAGNPRLRLRVLKSLAVVQEKFGKMSELQVTKGDLSRLKSEYDLGSDDDKIIDEEEEEENNQEHESSDDSEDDLINIGNGPVVKEEPGSSTTGSSPESSASVERGISGSSGSRVKVQPNSSPSEDILNKWLDTNDEELVIPAVKDVHGVSSGIHIKTEPDDNKDISSSKIGQQLTPRELFPVGTENENCKIKIKLEPVSIKGVKTSLSESRLEESWKVTSKKGKTLISRTPSGKAKKRSISELETDRIVGEKSSNKKHSSQVARKSPERSKLKDGFTRERHHYHVGKALELNVSERNGQQSLEGSQSLANSSSRQDSISASARKCINDSRRNGVCVSIAGQGKRLDHVSSSCRISSTSSNRLKRSNSEGSQVPLKSYQSLDRDTDPQEPRYGPTTMFGETSFSSSPSHPSHNCHLSRRVTMRVRVVVKDITLLVCVPLNQVPPVSFQWLADEASSRYHTSTGHRIQLSLATTEGALIYPDDIVSEILNNNEEVIGRIESWSQPQQKSSQEKQHSHLAIEHEVEHPANISSSHVPVKSIACAIKEQCQRSLQELSLSRSHIQDDNMHELAQTIQSLYHLSSIDLSHNEISYKGLQVFCQVLFQESEEVQRSLPLQHLTKMVLSNNPLTDNCALYISNIISYCPELNKLALSSSQLTSQFVMDHHAVVMQTAFGGAAKLQILDVSHNALGSAGVELLLQFLNPEKITSLVLSSVISSSGDSEISKHIASYCSQPDFALCSLVLEDCGLNDRDMYTLSKCLPVSKVWCHLDLSSNPLITNQGLFIFLQRLIASSCQLQSLNISLCGIESPLEVDLITLLVKVMTKIDQSQGHLSSLKLSNKFSHSDLELLKSIWQLAHGKCAQHQIDELLCTFSVKQGS